MNKVIITGCSSGLWLALSRVFLQNGYTVVGLSRTSQNTESLHLPVDLGNSCSIDKVVLEILHSHSWFSHIICCAGIWYIERMDELNYGHTDEMFRVNVTWHSYLLSKLSEEIIKSNADLVFVWATIAYKGNEFMPMYSASKWWFRWLVENWRILVKNTQNRVISICPGGMNTESNIWPDGRETLIAAATWKKVWSFLDVSTVAQYIFETTQLPKNMEISEVVINRK